MIEGIHVSTGFNRVGGFDRKPSDPDFRLDQYVGGTPSLDGLLGPFTNWMFAIIFVVLMLKSNEPGSRRYFLYGACAIANAWIRLLPMTWFFISTLFRRVHIEDEVEWGARYVSSLNFPMSNDVFVGLTKQSPMLFLSKPFFYFWPAFSMTIVLVCFIVAYRQLYRQLEIRTSSKVLKLLFNLSPLMATPFWFLAINFLDNLIRINW